MKKKLSLFAFTTTTLAIVILIMITGCATIISGSRQTVSFSSEPSDAVVLIDGFPACKTPSTISVKRNTKEIFVKKEGYMDTMLYYYHPKIKKYQIDPKTGEIRKRRVRAGKYYAKGNLWVFGNLLFWGFPGIIVDVITGANSRLDNAMFVTLIEKKKTELLKTQDENKPAKSKTDSLRELKKIFDEKLITKEEYESEKKKILAK